MKLIDASTLLAAEDADDQHFASARELLRSGASLATIDLCSYETANVAAVRWHDAGAGRALRQRIELIERHGTLVRVDSDLVEQASLLSDEHGLSVYDAAYVAAARRLGATLVSCDVRDLVDPGFAVLPSDAG